MLKYKSLILDMYLSYQSRKYNGMLAVQKADQIVKNLFSLDNNRTVKIDSKATISALGDNLILNMHQHKHLKLSQQLKI
ncbi:hypothetical protein [Mycoplasmopsis cynos]|uniref:Uncharacterized protein n=1 Tax=Mycoplasmopsis cynos TaxID=171284 RepID=A0A449AH78_9BACT|nr:hypothetical protein [Mycoplasmopsis cynos]VEU64328.1 Uncharacterised protein [Mycoplasmopsis cynos]